MALTQPHLPLLLLQVTALVTTHAADPSSHPHIAKGPKSQTVFLDPNHNATFSCEFVLISTSDSSFSRVQVITNGTIQHDISSKDQGNATHLVRTVSIPRKQEYNMTRIECLFKNEKAEGLLLIQGPPEAVSDLTVESSGNDLVVIWQAPFTLDVTGVEYDLLYSLLISDVTNETEPVPVACDICHNLTETNFTFSPNTSLQSPSFNFTVTPYNEAGRGPPRSVTATSDSGIYSTIVTLITETITSVIEHLSPSVSVPTGPDRKGNEASPGQVSGIVIGVIAAVLLLAGLILLFICIKYKCITRLRSQSSLLIGGRAFWSAIPLKRLGSPLSPPSSDKEEESRAGVRQRLQ